MNKLPPEILEVILLHVDGNDLKTARLVCHRWKSVIESSHFWTLKLEDKLKVFHDISFAEKCILVDNEVIGKNLVLNGDCSAPVIGGQFLGWHHVGNFHSNWLRQELRAEEIRALEGLRTCFKVPLTYGPNEMHQKIRYNTAIDISEDDLHIHVAHIARISDTGQDQWPKRLPRLFRFSVWIQCASER